LLKNLDKLSTSATAALPDGMCEGASEQIIPLASLMAISFANRARTENLFQVS
jgi:hypothetical protein